jgi:hypothetical protein
MRNFVSTLLVVIGLVGCSGKPAATCENASAHIKKLMLDSEELKKATGAEKQMAEKMLEELTSQVTQECKNKKWDEKQMNCVLAATKADQLEKCNVQN